jgi:hypothetical protein
VRGSGKDVPVVDVLAFAPVGTQERGVKRLQLALLARELRALVRPPRRGNPVAFDERDAELLGARPQRVGEVVLARFDVRRQGPTLLRRARTQLEGLPIEGDIVFVAQLLGLDEADVAPGSDVVGPDANDHDSSSLGFSCSNKGEKKLSFLV